MSTYSVGSVVGSIGGVVRSAGTIAQNLLAIAGGTDGSWMLSLQQAKYGDVPFGVITGGASVGRRAVVHEYPDRDEVWVEDMGKRARRFAITGFLLEGDLIYGGGPVIAQREKLIGVLEKRFDKLQPGLTLVHPSFGEIKNVCCINCDITEHVDHGRYFEVRFDFIVSGARKYPDGDASTGDVVADAAEQVQEASILDYLKNIASAVAKGAAAVKQAISTAVGWYQKAIRLINDVRRFFRSVSTLAGNFGSLFGGGNTGYSASNTKARPGTTAARLLENDTAARTAVAAAGAALTAAAGTPADGPSLGAAATTLAQAVAATANDPADQIRLLSTLADYQPADPTSSSQVGQAMATVQSAVGALMRRAALAQLAIASSSYQPASSDDAITMRNSIGSLIAKEITTAGDTGDDETYLALIELRAAVINDLNSRGAQLAAMTNYTFRAPMSSLVAAQRIYRDPGREAELIRQAQPIHPAFMPSSFTALSE